MECICTTVCVIMGVKLKTNTHKTSVSRPEIFLMVRFNRKNNHDYNSEQKLTDKYKYDDQNNLIEIIRIVNSSYLLIKRNVAYD